MVKSAETINLARRPEDVFRFVADLRNEPKWHTDVDSVPPDTDAVPMVGKTYALKFRPFMGNTDGTRSVELHAHGLMALMSPVMAFMVPRNNKAVVKNLQRELESRGTLAQDQAAVCSRQSSRKGAW